VNTSLIRECLELILMLADALERKKVGPPTVEQRPHYGLVRQIRLGQIAAFDAGHVGTLDFVRTTD
jgi:hypothetical protein